MLIVGANPQPTSVFRDVKKDVHTEGVAASVEPAEQGNIFNTKVIVAPRHKLHVSYVALFELNPELCSRQCLFSRNES